MPGGGTRTFLDPDHYEASLDQAQIQAVILPRDKFRARLTWAELHHSQVLRCEDDAPRVAYLQLAPGLALITFTADSGPLPVWRGTEMQAGDIVFHGRGERLHQFTPGPFVWNVIAMDPAQLEYWPAPIRHAVLLAIRGPDPAALSTHCSGSATPARAHLSPRRDKAQDIVAFRGRPRH